MIGKDCKSLNSIILPNRPRTTIESNFQRDSEFASQFRKLSLKKRDQLLSIKEDFKNIKL